VVRWETLFGREGEKFTALMVLRQFPARPAVNIGWIRDRALGSEGQLTKSEKLGYAAG
jgi:hypothetical protein